MAVLAAGEVLAGRFRLIRPLGEGGGAEVWLAATTAEGREVALKIARDAAEAAALREQAARTRALAHPLILPVEEYLAGPPDFLVMPFLPGGNIGRLRGAGYRGVLRALAGVAEAIEYAHRRGVVHRDLKASNVLLDARGECRVSDFAPARGSLPGMSPQQLDGAAPAPADDVYGFGALLYDLLAGQPLFHPDVSEARIRDEVPAIPVADLAGEALPEPLRRLLAAMLAKHPAERPPGLAAVRTALEDLLRETPAEGGVIRPADRARAAAPATVPPPPRRERHGLPARAVWAGLAVLAAVAAVVVFYLPAVVRERAPVQRAPATAPAAVPAAQPAPPEAAVPQPEIDAALGEFLRLDEELRGLNAEKWAGEDWQRLRASAQAADEAYRARDSAGALAGYQQAAVAARALVQRAPVVRSEALRAGEAALVAGKQAEAIAQFQTALWIAPQDAAARRGLQRAGQLDRVLALMRDAAAAEAAGAREPALDLYRQAARLDPAWAPATAAITRLTRAAARDAFETQMARGLAAQAGGDLAAARAAFEAALRARPGDAAASGALAQLAADEKLRRLEAMAAEARGFEQQERWADALARHEAALAEDPNLVAAREGAARAREREALDRRLRAELANADRFNDDAVLRKAQALLAEARAVAAPGPVLSGQAAELERLLQLAVIPVPVVLESDNLTQVTLFKVGRLGSFATRTLQLRPGAYTAVGSRPGYRDVRRSFRVAPAGTAPVVVRCEEPI